jgi:hypothetical protein
VRKNRTPGSVRGASGNWRPYRDGSYTEGNMSKQFETAEQAMHDRFVAIEAALEDLRPRT